MQSKRLKQLVLANKGRRADELLAHAGKLRVDPPGSLVLALRSKRLVFVAIRPCTVYRITPVKTEECPFQLSNGGVLKVSSPTEFFAQDNTADMYRL